MCKRCTLYCLQTIQPYIAVTWFHHYMCNLFKFSIANPTLKIHVVLLKIASLHILSGMLKKDVCQLYGICTVNRIGIEICNVAFINRFDMIIMSS